MSEKNFVPSAEDVDRQILEEFLDEVRDTVSSLDILLGNLRSKTADAGPALKELRHGALNLLTKGRGINAPLINLVVHRLDEYLTELNDITPSNVDDIQNFIDKIQGVLDGEVDDNSSEVGATLVRELPAKQVPEIDFGDIEPQNIEVLLVVPEKSMARIVDMELAACGIRTTKVRDPFSAFETVLRIKPDMVIASMELGLMNGVDLACALMAMPRTRNIPFALLTSYDRTSTHLDMLPPRAGILRKGKDFGEDLAVALERFRIT